MPELLSKRSFLLLLILCFAYLLIWQVKTVWPFTIDDMYISLRYAKNWVEGYGLLWNANEPSVEGYSNFSFVVLGSLAIRWGSDPVLLLKTAGVVGLLLTCVAIYHISRFWLIPRFAIIPCLWLLAYPGQILWSVSGLETTIYQALICWSVFFALHGLGYSSYPHQRENSRLLSFASSGLLLAMAGMTRPEAPALMGLIAILLWFNRPQPLTRSYRQGLSLFFSSLIVFFVPYFLWRWHYYGHLFPNPIYCKGFLVFTKLNVDQEYLHLVWPFFLISLPAIWRRKDRRHFFLWLPSVVYLILLIGADPVSAFANRLFLPAFVLLLPLALQGLQILTSHYLKRENEVFSTAMYLASFLLAFFFLQPTSLAGLRYAIQNPLAGEQLRQKVSQWLKTNIPESSRVMLSDAGLIPFLNKNPFIDSYCLNNATMIRPPKNKMFQRLCQEMLEVKPEVIILTSLIENSQVVYAPADACLAKRLPTSNDYLLRSKMMTKLNSLHKGYSHYRYEIYLRRDH